MLFIPRIIALMHNFSLQMPASFSFPIHANFLFLWLGIKANPNAEFVPRTVLIGGKVNVGNDFNKFELKQIIKFFDAVILIYDYI